MKTRKYILPYILLMLTACHSPGNAAVSNNKSHAKQAKKTIQKSDIFSGNYQGISGGQTVFATLTLKGEVLNGNLILNGEQAKLTGKVNNQNATGKITEDVSGKSYSFSAQRKTTELYLSITFPEYNNQTVQLVLQKTTAVNTSLTAKSRAPGLIGTWRHTEVISSGSGQFYSSFSTDYFVKFNPDGSALVWTGKSAGGSKDAIIEANANSNLQKMEWFTAGKTLYLVNPINKQQSAISFSAEANRMMLSANKNKKVYQRVN